jgi:2'-5' RNA ligase
MERKEPSLRLFFALWPSAAERAALAAWQPPLRERCGGRAMRADTLHATLVFLGDVAEHRLEALYLAAQETEFADFALNLATAHYWGHNHIVYAAPDVIPPQLADLVSELELNLRRHRFRFEQRAYKPHITLLRHAKWSDAPKAGNPSPTSGWTELTPGLPPMPAVRWRVRSFALVQSLSDEHGARYKVLARFGESALE